LRWQKNSTDCQRVEFPETELVRLASGAVAGTVGAGGGAFLRGKRPTQIPLTP
jgi:hypothetical protein